MAHSDDVMTTSYGSDLGEQMGDGEGALMVADMPCAVLDMSSKRLVEANPAFADLIRLDVTEVHRFDNVPIQAGPVQSFPAAVQPAAGPPLNLPPGPYLPPPQLQSLGSPDDYRLGVAAALSFAVTYLVTQRRKSSCTSAAPVNEPIRSRPITFK